jgi:uncharacterized protein YkwD
MRSVARILAAVLAWLGGSTAGAADTSWSYAPHARSPEPIASGILSDREAELLSRCGTGEAGLREVAKRAVARRLANEPAMDAEALAWEQRAAGEPHVWARAWVVSGRALDHESTLARLDAWRQSFRDLGQRRCGIATAVDHEGGQVVAAVAVDALADLAPMPTRVRTGMWITLDATMLVPATSARVVLVGPGGSPRAVPTAFDGTHVRARFTADRPGELTVQVIAAVETGPRPVLEARVFADVEPPTAPASAAAPGEDAAGTARGADALARMVAALRSAAGLRALARDARLDAIALAHARRMREARTVGHDVGDGDPAHRFVEAGLAARASGENVARAQTIQLAHRALYASPSHRANLVRADYTHLGVAAVEDPDGTVWVAEIFAADLR